MIGWFRRTMRRLVLGVDDMTEDMSSHEDEEQDDKTYVVHKRYK